MMMMMKSNLGLISAEETQQRKSHYGDRNELEIKPCWDKQIIVYLIVWIIGF